MNGEPCRECNGTGRFTLNQCPKDFVGQDISEAINMASLCDHGALPSSGGLLDQSAWFLSVWQTMKTEEVRIENEQSERGRHGG